MARKINPSKKYVIALLWFILTGSASSSPLHWLVYYGSEYKAEIFQKLDLAILDPDNMIPPVNKGQTKYIAYLSVGEADKNRSYWNLIADQKNLVESNPSWPGAYRVDIRSAVWQQLLLDKVIPEILKKGYDGLFLDNVDTPSYLEEKDAQKFRGAKEAMVQFVKNLRKKYPQMEIYPNMGLNLLEKYGQEIDGVVVEDLYDPGYKKETPTREKQLDTFKRQFPNKPILNIIYDKSATPPFSPLALGAIQRSEKKGYDWYLTILDLMSTGWVRP